MCAHVFTLAKLSTQQFHNGISFISCSTNKAGALGRGGYPHACRFESLILTSSQC